MAKFFVVIVHTDSNAGNLEYVHREQTNVYGSLSIRKHKRGFSQSNPGEFGTLALEISGSQNTWEVC